MKAHHHQSAFLFGFALWKIGRMIFQCDPQQMVLYLLQLLHVHVAVILWKGWLKKVYNHLVLFNHGMDEWDPLKVFCEVKKTRTLLAYLAWLGTVSPHDLRLILGESQGKAFAIFKFTQGRNVIVNNLLDSS